MKCHIQPQILHKIEVNNTLFFNDFLNVFKEKYFQTQFSWVFRAGGNLYFSAVFLLLSWCWWWCSERMSVPSAVCTLEIQLDFD